MMITRQRKKSEAEKSMEENRNSIDWKFYLTEFGILVFGVCGMWLFGSIKKIASDRILANCVVILLGLAESEFHFRRECIYKKTDYDNDEHVLRFQVCLMIGLVIALACGFLPVGGWPFLFVFVMLSLFSNMNTGILASSVLLLVSVLLCGGTVGDYALYLISGMFAVTLFRNLGNEFRIGIPLFLSVLCLLVCETANIVLVANAKPDFEMFVIPMANMIITSILLLGLLKLFSSMVVYRYREIYLDINDTENAVLAELKQENRQMYMHCIHTAYFCERLGKQFGLDVDALKCAAYYHKMGNALDTLMEEKQFPPAVKQILDEYRSGKKNMRKKETAVLVCSDTIVSSITYMIQRNTEKQIDYGKVIDAIFQKMFEDGSFDRCNITVEEFRMMQRIFKEEKLYYDFLH